LRNETDPLVRERIIHTLAELNTPAAAALLRAGLNDADPDVRIACCKGVGGHRDTESLTALTEVLRHDEDIDVRLAATRTLGAFRDPAAVSAMAIALEDRDPALQYRAVQSLRQMTGLDYGNDVTRWLEIAQRGELPPHPPVSVVERLRRLSPF
ncbi:MAG: HEAT repeat domain-containing protein, partial [Pirellulales bacterium]